MNQLNQLNKMMELLQQVAGLAVGPVTPATDKQNEILCRELPFRVLEYPSGLEHNGWQVPFNWRVAKAEIRQAGRPVYDGAKHPLGVIGYSESFQGRLPLAKLREHLYYNEQYPDDIVYHCDLYYKQHRRLWGFSLPYNLYKELTDGEYEVELITEKSPGQMKVLEYIHQGASDKTVILNTHNCHAAQLNDGPSSYVCLIELMKRLRGRKTKYSYRLVIAPEHLGTVFYLAGLAPEEISRFKLGIFLEMVGNNYDRFALQESFNGDSLIDQIARQVLKFNSRGYWGDGFRKIVGNDENVWEAPGVEVPMISLSRVEGAASPYPQYHLSSDNLDIIRPERLAGTVKILEKMVDVLEKNCYLKRKFSGLIALSNPRYDLYINSGTDPSIRQEKVIKDVDKWFDLMNRLPRYFEENMTILDIAIKHDLSFDQIYDYLVKFKNKGLLEFSNKKII